MRTLLVGSNGSGESTFVRRWLDKEHPIRWALDTRHHRRQALEGLLADVSTVHLEKHRIRDPREADPLLDHLAAEAFRN